MSSDNDEMEVDVPARTVATQENLPWVEKYRPQQLNDLISHTQIIDTISKLIDGDKLPHLLFYGPPGTGKTSTILAVARKIYKTNFNQMILELNASDDRGIDVVREQIKDFANTRSMFSKGLKLIILDEADAMTQPAQAALRRVIEKYTKTTRFCLICNYLNKIIPALQSRCTRFRFGPLKEADVKERVSQIATAERVSIDDAGLDAVVRLGQGDMRKCLNILQSAHMAYPKIGEEEIYQCTGQPLPSDINNILNTLLNEDFKPCYEKISQIKTANGLAIQDIITELHQLVLKLTVSNKIRMMLLDRIAETEYRLTSSTSEKLNLGALIGAFQIAREMIDNESQQQESK